MFFKTDIKSKKYPTLNTTVAEIGTSQCTDAYVVHANQNNDTVTKTDPTIAGGSLNSGSGS